MGQYAESKSRSSNTKACAMLISRFQIKLEKKRQYSQERIFNSLSGPGKCWCYTARQLRIMASIFLGVSKQRHISNEFIGSWVNASNVILSRDICCVWLSSSACQPNR